MRRNASPSSPSRKRPRLSSPTYDEQFELSQEEMQAFDAFDRKLSQTHLTSLRPSQALRESGRRKRDEAIASALGFKTVIGENTEEQEDAEVPSSPSRGAAAGLKQGGHKISLAGFSSAASLSKPRTASPTKLSGSGFMPAKETTMPMASTSMDGILSSSPDAPPEQDLASWFESSTIPLAGFKTAKCMTESDSLFESTVPPAGATGFRSAKAFDLPVEPAVSASATAENTFAGFASASSLRVPPDADGIDQGTAHSSDTTTAMFSGFATGASLLNPHNKEGWLAPSKEALARAAAKMELWEKQEDSRRQEETRKLREAELDNELENEHLQAAGYTPSQKSSRPVLKGVENSFSSSQVPETPTPAARFQKAAIVIPKGLPALHQSKKPFKSPLLSKTQFKPVGPSAAPLTAAYAASPLNPNRGFHAKSSLGFSTPSRTNVPSTPIRLPPSSPTKALGFTPRRQGTSKFVTPFKPGMGLGESGRIQLDLGQAAQKINKDVATPMLQKTASGPVSSLTKGKEKHRATFFDLGKVDGRQTLSSSGLVPQSYTPRELEAMGINANELSQITPNLAIYYSFHSFPSAPKLTSPSRPPRPPILLGPSAALSELQERGCSLATKQWVDNHWGLILWKLAGMACLDPERERKPDGKRWCWDEVMRQLLYRYERELNSASRPALRLITTQDAPAGSPMVLCVSDVTWTEGGVAADGPTVERVPHLEVTDGWYRLRAEIDRSLERAIRKGTLRVGRKIAVAGARLSFAGRKDPVEVLEAYDSVSLSLSGNSSHLAPWHAKLGFQRDPFIATLGSLTADGGVVAVMDLVIEKVYPIAYLEFVQGEDGQKRREGPRNEKDEMAVNEKWKARREITVSKLRCAFDKKMQTMDGYAFRLEQRAGSAFKPTEDDYPPDNIPDLLVDLEDNPDGSTIIKSVTRSEAGWLARAIREDYDRKREKMGDEMEQELNDMCPPREVRSFRVLLARDAQTNRRPASRKAQLTVWDVLGLTHSEGGKAGGFSEGQRFMVTNLMPSQPSAWMERDADSMIYLSTRRDSRWTRKR